MSTTTSLRKLPDPDRENKQDGDSPAPAVTLGEEADLPGRQRAALGELLRLVDERAKAESEARDWQQSNDAKVDAEYSRTRQGLLDKYVRLDQEARSQDESRRRAIVEAAMAGEAKAKADFAAASRRISAGFDAFRETARGEYNRSRAAAAGEFDAGSRQAAAENTEALKPLADALEVADGFRERLDAIAADYRKFRLDPEARPNRENHARFREPVDELFNRTSAGSSPACGSSRGWSSRSR
ncbi:MAG: hypothetical protein U0790_23630 [Isosphaeraceae bacterium]